MTHHALLGPSSALKWGDCLGSPFMERGIPNPPNPDADLGTAQHECVAHCLNEEVDADSCVGMVFNQIIIDEEMAGYVQNCVDEVRRIAKDDVLLVETEVPIEQITLEPKGIGTLDAAVFSKDGKTLHIIDHKFGYQKVLAKKNYQGMLYACGVIHQFAAIGDFETVIIHILQPRINHFDEWEVSVKDLEVFADDMRFKAQFIWRLLNGEVEFNPQQDLVPGDKACQWCRAKATCPALIKHTFTTISEDFVDLDKNLPAVVDKAVVNVDKLDNQRLGLIMQQAGLVEDFIKAIRARVETELFAGREVPGFKLVEGKKGNRKWEDEGDVEKTMKDMGVPPDLIYTKEIISVAKAEKLLKKDKKVWVKLHDLITQSDGKPSVAPSTDPRPALTIGATEDDFDMIGDENGR